MTILNKIKSKLHRYNAHGVGYGFKYVNGKKTNEICIVFYVRRKHPEHLLRKLGIEKIPEEIDGMKTDVIEVPGGFKKYSNDEQKKYRPFQGGVSGISIKEQNAAATLGYVNRKGEVLSNNHVLADEDLTVNHTAQKGDKFIQPSWLEGGTENDVVGELDRWVSLNPISTPSPCGVGSRFAKFFSLFPSILGRKGRFYYLDTNVNFVDGAVGIAYPNLWQSGVYSIGEAVGTVEPELGMKVQKVGRTTGLTKGEITAISVNTQVGGYQGIYTCEFDDQISISGINGAFSQPGDSGSAILTDEPEPKFVALLFAGGMDSSGNDITIASPYKYVKQYLNYDIP